MKHGAAGTRDVRAYLQGLQEVPAEVRGVDGELGTADWAAAAHELQTYD